MFSVTDTDALDSLASLTAHSSPSHQTIQANMYIYRVFIKYCVFHSNVVIFLNSASSAAAPRENKERPESGIIKKNI